MNLERHAVTRVNSTQSNWSPHMYNLYTIACFMTAHINHTGYSSHKGT